jgi:hypothetical protein
MKSRRVRGEEIIKQEGRKIIRKCRKCSRLLSFSSEELGNRMIERLRQSNPNFVWRKGAVRLATVE